MAPGEARWTGAERRPADEQMRLQAGTRWGPYEILSLIGTGGMGEVYQARDARLDRQVGLKVVSNPPAKSI